MSVDKKFEEFSKITQDRIHPQPIQQQTIEVELCGEGSLVDHFAELDYKALKSYVEFKGGIVPFTCEEFIRYNRTGLYSRIAWVRGDYYIVHPNDKIIFPAFLSVVCSNIGLAQDYSRGITLMPKMYKDVTFQAGVSKEDILVSTYNLLTKRQMLEISNFLKAIEAYKGSEGYLKDKTGTFDFMSMQLLDGVIMRHDAQAHPVYALLASVVAPHVVVTALSPLVRYGDVNFLDNLLWEVVSI